MRLASDAFESTEAALFCSKLLPEFNVDGSLRDIYVLNTTGEDWGKLVTSLVAYSFVVEMSPPFDDVGEFDAATVFKHVATTAPVLMKVFLSPNVSANCHFFTTEEVEFDLDPKQINSKTDVAHIINFMRAIGVVLSKDVMLTAENTQSDRIATFKSATGEFLTQ